MIELVADNTTVRRLRSFRNPRACIRRRVTRLAFAEKNGNRVVIWSDAYNRCFVSTMPCIASDVHVVENADAGRGPRIHSSVFGVIFSAARTRADLAASGPGNMLRGEAMPDAALAALHRRVGELESSLQVSQDGRWLPTAVLFSL